MPTEKATLPRKERLILERLVGAGPAFGQQLVDESSGALKRGTVYVTLSRMEAKGLITSEQEAQLPGAVGLPRRIYRVTGLGARLLNAWATFQKALAMETRS